MRTAAATAPRGFTLIELLLVMALIAMASGLATLALRDPAESRLEREGARLAALLESARAEPRAAGLGVVWQPLAAATPMAAGTANGGPPGADFLFVGLPAGVAMPTRWLQPGVVAEVIGARTLVLGPEPLIGAQRVVLRIDDRQLALATDGLAPFAPVTDELPASSPVSSRAR